MPPAGGVVLQWINQHLRIKAIFGTSENAAKTQILSLTLFKKTPILQALQAPVGEDVLVDPGKQLILFD